MMSTKKRRRSRREERDDERSMFGFMRHGGARKGAGRKRKAVRDQVSHRTRERVTKHQPIHVTIRLVAGVPSMRTTAAREVLENAVEGANERGRVRIVHYSAQSNHLHMIVESASCEAMSNGMQGLLASLGKRLNKLWRRAGRLFADRYHGVILTTPTQVRNVLAYVLKNHKRHEKRARGLDAFSSGAWFDGWREQLFDTELARSGRRVVASAKSWLLGTGWRKRGLISIDSAPGG